MGLERLMWRENSCGEASANVNSLERLTAMWNPKTTVDGVGGVSVRMAAVFVVFQVDPLHIGCVERRCNCRQERRKRQAGCTYLVPFLVMEEVW